MGINGLINKYTRQLERAKREVEKLKSKQENLSEHGFWDLGYFESKASCIESFLDEL